MDHTKTALAIIAWFGALAGPPFVAISCWKWARRIRAAWLVHLAFTPLVLACEWLSAYLLFWASGDTGDGPPGLGLAFIPCAASMLLTIMVYFGCLVATSFQKRSRTV